MHSNTEENSLGPQRSQPTKPQVDQPVALRTRRLSSAGSKASDEISAAPDSSPCRAGHNACLPDRGPTIKEIAEICRKEESERSEQEVSLLETAAHLIPAAHSYLKSKQEKELLKQRLKEVEESYESIQTKTDTLARLIKESKHIVIYTGAGISTSASIPDYRGPNGIWTQIKRTGSFSITKLLDLSNAKPTFTHMAIKELCRRRLVKHVVSQNCDGLHLRSGIAQSSLSEIHGNMYIEVCPTCERQYFREADVTQRTCRFRHKTGRKCHTCEEPNNNLIDTIVLYGERSRTKWPMNWERASKSARNADLIICMGSSLKTLRRYSCLWPSSSSKKTKSDTKLVIINLQHTPKDKNAFMKINGKCDLVMESLMRRLNIVVPEYQWTRDPLVELAVPFTGDELARLKRNLIFDSSRFDSSSSPLASNGDALSSPSSVALRKCPIDDESRCSPSLFVSELTDEPDKKRLRMRIRAVNVGATGSCSSTGTPDKASSPPTSVKLELARDGFENSLTDSIAVGVGKQHLVKPDPEEQDSENLSQQDHVIRSHHQRRLVEYSPPGWLGKSLGASKSSSYRRKRHGNKGRKRPQALPTTTELTMAAASPVVTTTAATAASINTPAML